MEKQETCGNCGLTKGFHYWGRKESTKEGLYCHDGKKFKAKQETCENCGAPIKCVNCNCTKEEHELYPTGTCKKFIPKNHNPSDASVISPEVTSKSKEVIAWLGECCLTWKKRYLEERDKPCPECKEKK